MTLEFFLFILFIYIVVGLGLAVQGLIGYLESPAVRYYSLGRRDWIVMPIFAIFVVVLWPLIICAGFIAKKLKLTRGY